MENKQRGKRLNRGRVVALTAACVAVVVVAVVGIKRYGGGPSRAGDVPVVTRAELKALVLSGGQNESWKYYGTAGGFHYFEGRRDQIIIPGPAQRYKVAEWEMAIPRAFEFKDWNSDVARLIFLRVKDGGGAVVDPEWIELP